MYVCVQGDWVWLDVSRSDSEFDVAVGAIVIGVDNSRVHLRDDDKQVTTVRSRHTSAEDDMFPLCYMSIIQSQSVQQLSCL